MTEKKGGKNDQKKQGQQKRKHYRADTTNRSTDQPASQPDRR